MVFFDRRAKVAMMWKGRNAQMLQAPKNCAVFYLMGHAEVLQGKVYELRVGLGDVTNNAAEYLALIYGMRTALHMGMKRLLAKGDSQLVVCQELAMYHRELRFLAELFEVFEICEASRAENALADKAAAEGLNFPAAAG